MNNFILEFAMKLLIIIMIFIVFISALRLFAKVWNSRTVQKTRMSIHHWILRCEEEYSWSRSLIKIGIASFAAIRIAFCAFHQIQAGDSIEQTAKKIRHNFLLGSVYDVMDYWLSILCALMVSYLNDWQWSFAAIILATWIFDILCTLFSLFGYWLTKKDFTLGEAHRRASDALYQQSSVIAGRVYRVVQHVTAVIWDGPEQLIVFYRKELKEYGRMILAIIPLTLLQGLFWAWTYSFGHETVLGWSRTFLK
jgi:hypothetical protein